MLSVSGARGIVGESMTPAVAVNFAAAFGSFVKASTGSPRPVFYLGRDTRPSSEMLAAAAAAGLTSVGGSVVDLGVVATPTVAVMVDERRADGGMMITASHNPAPWNGLKCITAGGVAPPPADGAGVARRLRPRANTAAGVDDAASVTLDSGGNDVHIARVLTQVRVGDIRAARPRVVFDSINGAGCVSGRALLEALGCDVIQINGDPDGRFVHDPEPVEANLQQLTRQTVADGADLGLATDPDADRLAVVDERGRYVGEESTLVLAARCLLDRHGGAPIVVNLSTSRMIDDLAERYDGAVVIRTPVGEANVAAGMQRCNALVGGEGNGGVIFPPVCRTRDSLTAMALVLDLVAAEGRMLSSIVDDLPAYVMIKHRFDLDAGANGEAAASAAKRVAERFANEDLDTTDGIRVDVADGWVHLRPSNTEPIMRLIAEARTQSRAWELLDEVAVAAGLK